MKRGRGTCSGERIVSTLLSIGIYIFGVGSLRHKAHVKIDDALYDARHESFQPSDLLFSPNCCSLPLQL